MDTAAPRSRRSPAAIRSLVLQEVFVDGLYRLMLDNRGLLAVVSGFAAAQPPELATIDPAYAVRFTFALIFGVAVLDHARMRMAV